MLRFNVLSGINTACHDEFLGIHNVAVSSCLPHQPGFRLSLLPVATFFCWQGKSVKEKIMNYLELNCKKISQRYPLIPVDTRGGGGGTVRMLPPSSYDTKMAFLKLSRPGSELHLVTLSITVAWTYGGRGSWTEGHGRTKAEDIECALGMGVHEALELATSREPFGQAVLRRRHINK